MMDFARALDIVFKIEGLESDNPADDGGLTKFGISSVYYPEVRDPNFSKARAAEIYRTDFWERFHCHEMPPAVALMVFDAAVNQTAQTARLLQRALGVSADGVIGPATIKAVNAADAKAFLLEFTARRAVAYSAHADIQTFGLGWFRRLSKVAAIAHSEVNI